MIPRDNDESFQLFPQYADKVHVNLTVLDYEGMWLIMIRNWLKMQLKVTKNTQIFKTNSKFCNIWYIS